MANTNLMEKEEVLLNQGDGMLDAGNLTRCKDAVCFIYIGCEDSMRRATGFFATISIKGNENQVIVTNNHVIDNIEVASNAVARFHYEGKIPGAETKLLPDKLFHTDKVLDYTIVGCDHELIRNSYCIEPVPFDYEDDVNVGDDIFIFQHPKGKTKKFSYQQVSNIEPPFIYYNADTDIGSSGSLVVHRFKLIALHSKGSDSLLYNKGTLCSEILNHLNHGKYTEPKSIFESADRLKRKIVNGQDSSVSAAKKPRLADIINIQHTDERIPSSCNDSIVNPSKLVTSQPSEDLLEELSKDIASYWKHLGRKLKVPNSKIEKIQKDHYNYDDISEKAFAMLMEWKESGEDNSENDLYNTLIRFGKVDTALRYFSHIA